MRGKLSSPGVEESFQGADRFDVRLKDVQQNASLSGQFDGTPFALQQHATEHPPDATEAVSRPSTPRASTAGRPL